MRTLAYGTVMVACVAAVVFATSPWSFTAAMVGFLITGLYMIRGAR